MFQSNNDFQRKISLFTIFSFLFYLFIDTLLLSLPYFQLDLDTQIFSETLRNWNSYSILDLTVATTCPDGYQSLTPRSWSGVSFGCWCNNPNPVIHSNPCTPAELTAGCLDIPSEPSRPLNLWASKGGSPVQICIKRSSERWSEVSKISIKGCPKGYKQCGASWENIYCTKETKCPITRIQIHSMTTTDQTKCLTSPQICVVLDDSAINPRMIQFRRGNTFDGMPIVDVRINEYGMCHQLNQDNITPNRPQFPLLNSKEESCKDEDYEDRSWEKIDEMTERTLFDLNGLSGYINSFNGFTSNGMSGYYQTGKTGDDYKWGIFARQYFPWRVTCREEMDKVVEKLNNIDQIKTIQMLVMIFGVITGCLLGVGMVYVEVQQMRGKKIFFVNITWDNEQKLRRFWMVKDGLVYLFGILQVPVGVWSLIVVGKTRSLFLSVYKRRCAGDLTGEALNTFALERLTQCFACTVISLSMTGALLALYFGMARQRNKGLKGGRESSRVIPVESEDKSISYGNQSSSGMILVTGNSQNSQIGRRIRVNGSHNGEFPMRRRMMR